MELIGLQCPKAETNCIEETNQH